MKNSPIVVTAKHNRRTLRPFWGALFILAGFNLLCVNFLLRARSDARRMAMETAASVARVICDDIARNVEFDTVFLNVVKKEAMRRDPSSLAAMLRNIALFDQGTTIRDFGSVMVLNEKGDVIADSRARADRSLNLMDRSYFQAHLHNPHLGLLISGPLVSRLDGSYEIVLSERIENLDGSFGGVVASALRVHFFQDLFRSATVGSAGTVALATTSGKLMMREPYDPAQIGTDLIGPVFARVRNGEASGTGAGVLMLDNHPRIYAFQTVRGQPLVIAVTISEHDVYAAWWRRAAAIGMLMLFLSAATLALAILLCRELKRRDTAELSAREAEADLRRLNDTLETRVTTEIANRQEAQARLARAQHMEALGQLASGIAHDFNNVLQSVGGAGSLILQNPGNTSTVERLARIVVEVSDRGTAITRRLLAFTRRGDEHPVLLEPVTLLQDLRLMLLCSLGSGIEITVDAPKSLPCVLTDKPQLETVLVNLAVNARDAMPFGGSLVLFAECERVTEGRGPFTLAAGDYIRIGVRDTGEGMDANTLAHAGEPFFTTKPAGKGTGLGLSMAKGFAQNATGTLTIDSRKNIGTEVTLWLPVADSSAPQVVVPLRSEPTTGRVAHILLVEDDSLICELLAEDLRGRGHAVQQARDGTDALHKIDKGIAIDVLITDLTMPGIDGSELIRAARQRRPGLPAIIVTGQTGAVDPDESRCVVMSKPVQSKDLLREVENLLKPT